jgi:hypothetical protein
MMFSTRWLTLCGLLLPTLFAAPPAEQWTTATDPSYTVQVPPRWTASHDREKGWVRLTGLAGEEVVIWPVFIPEAPTGLDWQSAQYILRQLAAACPYRAQWEPPEVAGTSTLRARGRGGNTTAVSAFTWLASPRGAAGYFYAAAAREADFGARAADFERIFRSFRLIGRPGGAQGGGQWVLFSDQVEGAFTAEVPAGWKTAGGMMRTSPDDPRPVVESTSPDGKIRVGIGDPALPTVFIEYGGPSPFPEGTANGPAVVMRYLTGAWYCRYYISQRAPMVCSDVQITGMKDMPELAQRAVSIDASLAQVPFSIGSTTFQCREQGQLKTGYCEALTSREAMPYGGQTGMWHVRGQKGFMATPENAAQAKAAMDHIAESVRFNPQWGMQEVQNAGVRSRIRSNTANQIADMAAASAQYKDAVESRMARLRSDATLGVVRMVDPATGRRTTVDSGADYYWVDPSGSIVGTRVDTSPGVDFRRLLELPAR